MAAAPSDNRPQRGARHRLRRRRECPKMTASGYRGDKKTGPRLFGRARHLGHPALGARFLRLRGGGVLRRRWPGRGNDGLEQKALATGASKLYLEDLRDEFARDFVFPMMRANAVYEGYYLLGTSIARPVIAKRQVEIAHAEGADAVGHGATGKGNDQVRFEFTFARLAPELKVIAPWRHPQWPFQGPRRHDRLRRREKNPRAGHRREALLDGPQPGPYQLRGRHPRRPLARALRRHVPAHRRAAKRA